MQRDAVARSVRSRRSHCRLGWRRGWRRGRHPAAPCENRRDAPSSTARRTARPRFPQGRTPASFAPSCRSRISLPVAAQTTCRIAASSPRAIRIRVPLAPSCTPAPTSRSSAACSNTRTWWPRWISASAAVSPPRPAPAIRISAIGFPLFPPFKHDGGRRPTARRLTVATQAGTAPRRPAPPRAPRNPAAAPGRADRSARPRASPGRGVTIPRCRRIPPRR